MRFNDIAPSGENVPEGKVDVVEGWAAIGKQH